MKRLRALLILMGLLLPASALAQYMSSEEIQEEFTKLSARETFMDDRLSDAAKERLKNLKPLNVFINPQARQTLKKSYRTQQLEQLVSLPASTDIRNRDAAIKSQDNGKCTAYAGTALIENLLQRNGKIPGLNLSEWDSWFWYGQYSCEAFVAALTKNYICDEKDYPQYGSRSAACRNNEWVKLSSTKYIDDDVNAMKEALAKGNPVYIGMATPNSMLNCDKVINPKSGIANGGHALGIVGYDILADGTVLAKIRNSWGADCGDKGYQYYPMNMCQAAGAYCIMWEFGGVDSKKPVPIPTAAPTVKPTPVPTAKPTPAPTPKVCLKYKGMWWWKKCIKWSE